MDHPMISRRFSASPIRQRSAAGAIALPEGTASMKNRSIILALALTLPVAAMAATNPPTTNAGAKVQNVIPGTSVPAPAQVHGSRKAAKAVCQQQVDAQKQKTHAAAKGAQLSCEAK
jgi:hypothetical protein